MQSNLIALIFCFSIDSAFSLLCFDGDSVKGVVVRPVDFRFQCFNITNKPDDDGELIDHYVMALPILFEGLFVDVGKCVRAPYGNKSMACACDSDYCNCPKCRKEKPTADLEWWEQRFQTSPKPKIKMTREPKAVTENRF